MHVAMYYSNQDIRLEEFPKPQISNDEILMRVEASGICGSDVMEWYRSHKVPLVLGHEVAGVVEEIGPSVKNFKVRDRIVATHHVPCEECRYCRNGHEAVCSTLRTTNFYPGGFSQYLRLPVINVRKGTFKIPEKISFSEATFTEPLGCVIRGQRLAGMNKGKKVLVVGSGMAGLLHIKLAKWNKASMIAATDIDSFRLKVAKNCGADTVILADEDALLKLKEAWNGQLADLVIICSGSQSAIAQGLRAVDRGGTALIFTAAKKDETLPLSTNDIFWRTEVTLLSSYAAGPRDLKEALRLIARQEITVKELITHHLPLRETQKGFQLVCQPKESIKIIIEPQS